MGGRDAFGPDVGNAVALGVRAVRRRVPGEVGAEAVGSAETGALAKEHEGKAGAESVADLVLNFHAGKRDEQNRSNLPTGVAECGDQWNEDGGGVVFRSGSGETVGDDDGEIEISGMKLCD